MRRGIFDGYYQIDIVEDLTVKKNLLSLRITFSELEYPEFTDYIRDKIFKDETISYKDEKNNGEYYILGFSVAKANKNHSMNPNKIHLRKEIYGDLAEKVPIEKKRSFVTTQYYGKIEIRRKD